MTQEKALLVLQSEAIHPPLIEVVVFSLFYDKTANGQVSSSELKRLIRRANQVSNNIDQLITSSNRCCDSNYNICTAQSTSIYNMQSYGFGFRRTSLNAP